MSNDSKLYIAFHLYCDAPFGGAERRLLRAYSDVAKQVNVDLIVREHTPGAFEANCKLSGITEDSFQEIRICSSRSNKIADILALFYCLDRRYTNHVFFDFSRFNSMASRVIRNFSKAGVVFTSANCAYGMPGELLGPNCEEDSAEFEHLIRSSSWVDVLYPNQKALFESITGKENVSITPGTFTDLDLCRPGSKRKLVVFLSARLNEMKNPQLMIDAVKQCDSKIRESGYEVWICGKGSDYEFYHNQIKDSALDDIIQMPGYVKSDEILANAQAVCVLSAEENYPSQVIAEGCACGCFIIATNVGNTSAIIEEPFGTLVSCDANAIAQAICDYIELSEEEKAAIICDARNYAEKEFTLNKTVQYFLKVNWLASQRRDQTKDVDDR